jgi:hypothetical protein
VLRSISSILASWAVRIFASIAAARNNTKRMLYEHDPFPSLYTEYIGTCSAPLAVCGVRNSGRVTHNQLLSFQSLPISFTFRFHCLIRGQYPIAAGTYGRKQLILDVILGGCSARFKLRTFLENLCVTNVCRKSMYLRNRSLYICDEALPSVLLLRLNTFGDY